MYREGNTCPGVELIRSALSLSPSPCFDAELTAAVKRFQSENQLVADGLVGPKTWDALAPKMNVTGHTRPVKLKGPKLEALVKKSLTYSTMTLAPATAQIVEELIDLLAAAGGQFTTAGGMRGLSARVTSARSPTSFHYLGRAFDLGTYTGMVDPLTDPFVVVRDESLGKRHWRVFARVTSGITVKQLREQGRSLMYAIKRDGSEIELPADMQLLDFTAEAQARGFQPIACREKAWEKPSAYYGGSEWWHFQDERGLVKGQTFFGEELLRVHRLKDLQGTGPWERRHAIFKRDWA